MPRTTGFQYQIDETKNRKEQEMDLAEEEYNMNEADDGNDNNNSEESEEEYQQEEDSEDDEDEDLDLDEDVEDIKTSKRTSSRSDDYFETGRNRAKKTRKYISRPSAARADDKKKQVHQKRRPSRRTKSSSPMQPLSLSDSEDEDGEGSKEIELKTPKRLQKTRSSRSSTRPVARRRVKQNDDGSSDEHHKKPAPFRQDILANLPSPKRSSATKAKRKMKQITQEEELGSDRSDEVEQDELPAKVAKRRKRAASSDEEFEADSESESSQDDDVDDELDVEDDEIVGDPDDSEDDDDAAQDEKAVNIDIEEVGTADDSSGDEQLHLASPKKSSASKDEILPSPHKGTFENSDESDEDGANDNAQVSHPRLPPCPSTTDAITAEALPRRHVCYISPDGGSRQCFKLETLRQIALQSSRLELRVDLDGQRQNFLQPPHFRTAASDHLVDQIASRFGRDALVLDGPYYNKVDYDDIRLSDEEMDDSSDDDNKDVYAYDTFRDRVKRYFDRGMGSQDVYCCPLCYSHTHQQIVNPKAEDKDEIVATEFIYDPIEVLASMDNNELKIAAQICFTKAADVKKHLCRDHDVDTRDVQGNDLYARYKVRAPDGLLQRWLRHNQGTAKQGDMRIYWSMGNNQSFIQLLDEMKRAKVYLEDVQRNDVSDDEKDEAEEYTRSAQDFYDSFAVDALPLWNQISAPFLKGRDNVKDFIAEDDELEEDSEDENNHAVLHRELTAKDEESDVNDFLHKIQRRYAEDDDNDVDQVDNDGTNNSSDEEELEIVDSEELSNDEDKDEDSFTKKNGYYSPIEEEDDDWMKERTKRPKRNSMALTKKENNADKNKNVTSSASKTTPIGKKLHKRLSTASATITPKTPVAQLSATKETPAIRESDDED